MTQGESIAPSADITMRLVGTPVANRQSIDPTDYMGQSFVYTEWLKKKIKEYQNQKTKEAVNSQEAMDLERLEQTAHNVIIPEAELNESAAKEKMDAFLASPEYKKMQADKEVAKTEWLATHGPVTGGRFQDKEYGIDRYQSDYNKAKSDVNAAIKLVGEAKNKADLDDANAKLKEATSRLQKVISLVPTTPEGKEAYKDEIVWKTSKGINYAAGWGAGGYHGTGPGSTELRDQLLAQVTGGKVGQAVAVRQLTPTEIMNASGFSLTINPDTGNLGYFKLDASGNIMKDDSGKQIEYTGGFAAGVTGKGIKQYAIADNVGEANTKAYKDMIERFAKSGQRLTSEQAQDVVSTFLTKEQSDKYNILAQKIAYANMFPTDENKQAAADYQKQIVSNVGRDSERIISSLIGKGAATNETFGIEDVTRPNVTKGMVVGTIGGKNIYQSKLGTEYIELPGVTAKVTGGQMSLAQLTDLRQQAEKSGEYSAYNFSGRTGSDTLSSLSKEAQQKLTKILPGYSAPEEKIQRVGDVKFAGETLPIFSKPDSYGREFVQLKTGGDAPLQAVVAMKELETGGGVYANNPGLRDAQLNFISSYKLASIDPTGENMSNFQNAYKNLYTNPEFTYEMRQNMESMANLGGKYAGVQYDDEVNKWVPTENVAKSTLKYVASTPLHNVQNMGLLSREELENKPTQDIARAVSKFGGDPVLDVVNVKVLLEKNPEIKSLDPSTKGYNNIINALAREAATTNREGTGFSIGGVSAGLKTSNPYASLSSDDFMYRLARTQEKYEGYQKSPLAAAFPMDMRTRPDFVETPQFQEVGGFTNRLEGPWTPKEWSVRSSVSASLPQASINIGKSSTQDYKPKMPFISTSVKTPTIVANPSKVYAKMPTSSYTSKKGTLPGNIVLPGSTMFRKSKQSKPKLDSKKKTLKKISTKATIISMDNILGNTGSISNIELQPLYKNNGKSKGISSKAMTSIVSDTISSFKLKKKNKL